MEKRVVVRPVGEDALVIARLQGHHRAGHDAGDLLDESAQIEHLRARIDRLLAEQGALGIVHGDLERVQVAAGERVALVDRLDQVLVAGLPERRGQERAAVT